MHTRVAAHVHWSLCTQFPHVHWRSVGLFDPNSIRSWRHINQSSAHGDIKFSSVHHSITVQIHCIKHCTVCILLRRVRSHWFRCRRWCCVLSRRFHHGLGSQCTCTYSYYASMQLKTLSNCCNLVNSAVVNMHAIALCSTQYTVTCVLTIDCLNVIDWIKGHLLPPVRAAAVHSSALQDVCAAPHLLQFSSASGQPISTYLQLTY